MLRLAPDNLAAIRGLAEMHGSDADEPVHQAFAPPPDPPPPAPVVVVAPPAPPAIAPPAEPFIPPQAEPHVEIVSSFGPGDPDFAALDASIAAASLSADAADIPDLNAGDEAADNDGAQEAQRAAQIERLEIWLARLDELRRSGARHA